MTEEEEREIVRRYEVERLSYRQISVLVGYSYGAVQKVVARHGTPRPRGSRPALEPAPCGTKRGHLRHLADGEEPDEACVQANRDYTAAHERRTGRSTARSRAHRSLADLHDDVFGALRQEEDARAQAEREGEPARVWRGRARERAYRRLAKLYRGEFAVILAEEKAEARAERASGTGEGG